MSQAKRIPKADPPIREATSCYHPRSPDASPERLRELAGSIVLTGPVPSWKFLGDDEEDEYQAERAGD